MHYVLHIYQLVTIMSNQCKAKCVYLWIKWKQATKLHVCHPLLWYYTRKSLESCTRLHTLKMDPVIYSTVIALETSHWFVTWKPVLFNCTQLWINECKLVALPMRPDHHVIKCDEALLEGQRGKLRKGQKREGWTSGGEKEGRREDAAWSENTLV